MSRWQSVLVILFVPVAVLSAAGESGKMLADGVAAQVNEKTITIGEVMAMLQPFQRQLAGRYSGDELKVQLRSAYKEALNSLVERRLILDCYNKQENKFPDAMLDERVEEIVQDMFKGDHKELSAALARERVSYDEWKSEMKDHVIVGLMRRMNVDQNVSVSSRDIRKAYEDNIARYKKPGQVKLRMIVFSIDSAKKDDAGKKQKAEEVRKKLVEGVDFAETAKAVSEGDKAADGGDWGWVDSSIFRPELSEKISVLKAGQISDVVETADELYIIKVEDRKAEAVASFEEVQLEIEREFRKAASERLYASWIKRLRKDAYIKVYDTDLF